MIKALIVCPRIMQMKESKLIKQISLSIQGAMLTTYRIDSFSEGILR